MPHKPQVSKDHYFRNYDTKKRWISYWYQIREVLGLKPKKVLEIGIGNKTVSDYLKKCGIKVVTLDIDKNLEPDYIGSITELTEIFKKNSFDVILCAEVLEHLPFSNFEKSLTEIKDVTKKHVVLTLPHYGIYARITLELPKIHEKTSIFKTSLPVTHKFVSEHYWEIGKRNYSLKKIKKVISKHFNINKSYCIPENLYHRVFVFTKNKIISFSRNQKL